MSAGLIACSRLSFNAALKNACDSKGIVIPTYNGKQGHPIIVSVSHVDEIMKLDEASPEGLRAFINANKKDCLEVPVETSAVIEDIDTPEDYQRLSKQAEPLYEHHNWHP